MTAAITPELIEVKVQTLHQLFNSMDPSPFHERDLDREAEHFIVSWAQEHHIGTPLRLIVHLGQRPEKPDATQMVTESIHNYFAYRADLNRREFRRLMRNGWTTMLIGLCFLAVCMTAAQTFTTYLGKWHPVMTEGLTIIGWVAMWRPIDTYLYRWWPLRNVGKIYAKLSEIPVEVRLPTT